MELAGERKGGQARRREHESPTLEREQRRRKEERHEPEEMSGRLSDPVRHEAEDEAADERRRSRDLQCAQPPAREPAGEHEREQHHEVVRPDVPECRRERPVRDAEQPALEVRRRLGLGTERVRVDERRLPLLELVAYEPEGPAKLEVVAGCRLSVTCGRPGEVVVVDVADSRPRRPDGARGIERDGEDDETRGDRHRATVSPSARFP